MANSAQFISQIVPSPMFAGQVYSVSLTFKNNGTTTWVTWDEGAQAGYRLSTRNPTDNTIWVPINRVELLPGTVIAPGSSLTRVFDVTAPATPGSYNFQFGVIQELVEHFFASSTNLVISVVAAPRGNMLLMFP